MYENKLPEVDDLVMVNVKSIAENRLGAYVSLLEYNNVEGMILFSELSRRRIRSISKLIRVGRQEVVVVLRVDKEKGYIDLSKRRVSPEDVGKCEEKYNKSKAVHSIMRHVAELTKKSTEELYKSFGWPLYKKFGHAYEAFNLAINDPSILDVYNIEPSVKEEVLKVIKRRLAPQACKLRADFEVTCFEYDGIDSIKAALLKGQNSAHSDIQIKIKLVAPPLFVMISTTHDKELGIQVLNEALEKIATEIKAAKGTLTIKNAPRAISEREISEFNKQLEELEKKSAPQDGDNDNSEDEEEDSAEE
jgi:translation initiation factor 2 subunit 1